MDKEIKTVTARLRVFGSLRLSPEVAAYYQAFGFRLPLAEVCGFDDEDLPAEEG